MPIRVMVAGLSGNPLEGKMARLVAEAVVKQGDMVLYPWALAEMDTQIQIGGVDVCLVSEHSKILAMARQPKISQIDLVVDFTQPKSVNKQAKLYCDFGVPFVMGTTGGDRKLLIETVQDSCVPAVVTTNFSDPVTIMTEMIRMASERFPDGLKGFRLFRRESHQGPDPVRPDFKGKTDPSGTMVDLQPALEKLIGAPVTTEQIVMIRDRRVQEFELDVRPENLDGHAFHKYVLRSDDGTVELIFEHNVLGRNTYIPLRAIRFIAKHLKDKGRVFSELDVLEDKE